jgi:hypothetical protein
MALHFIRKSRTWPRHIFDPLGRVDKAHPAMNCRDLVSAKPNTVLNITYCFAPAKNFLFTDTLQIVRIVESGRDGWKAGIRGIEA